MIKYISCKNTKSKHKRRIINKITPYKWIRDLTSSIDIGKKKIKRNGEKGVPHMNTIKDVLAAFNSGQWWRIDKLCNLDLDDHFASRETYYFTAGNGDRVLIMIDVDCKSCGCLAGALAYCQFLSETFLPGLYFEPSTNGRGAHGYVIVETHGMTGKWFNQLLLKRLVPYLNMLADGFDIEFVEVKGTMPDFGWGEAKGELRTFRCGCLAKLPRDVTRFDEWQKTTVINVDEFLKLPVVKPSKTKKSRGEKGSDPGKVVCDEDEKEERGTPLRGTSAKSCSGTLIDDAELVLMRTRYGEVAEHLMNGKSLKTSGKHVATVEDMAILLCVGKFCTANMNPDGTMPFDRIKGLWESLKSVGDVERPFENKRYGAIRDHLSEMGLLDWEDHTYVVGINGQTGQPCKWRFSAELMEMLTSDVLGEGRTSFTGTRASETLPRPSRSQNQPAELAATISVEGRENILEGHSASETDDFLRPERVITTFDFLVADAMVDQIITGWGDSVLAA